MIDLKKRYRTRDGHEVRLYATDHGDKKFPVIGAISYNTANTCSYLWTADGKSAVGYSPSDLIEVKPRITGWMNVYEHLAPKLDPILNTHLIYEGAFPGKMIFKSRNEADRSSCATLNRGKRIACIPVDFEEGQGL